MMQKRPMYPEFDFYSDFFFIVTKVSHYFDHLKITIIIAIIKSTMMIKLSA